MQVAKVVGTVVSTNKSEKLTALKLLLVQPLEIRTMKEKGGVLIAIDAVGAGPDEVVMLVAGSSSRQTALTDNIPTDLAIVAIIDYIDLGEERIFEKYSVSSGNDQ